MERYRRIEDSTNPVESFSPGRSSALFGPPHLLSGEDPEIYEELLTRVRDSVEPVDIIEELLVDDFVASQWEATRWRRLTSCLLNAAGHGKLNSFLEDALDSDQYSDDFEKSLAERLQPELTEAEARELAGQYSRKEPDAVEKVDEILSDKNLTAKVFEDAARSERAQQLVKQYVAGKPGAVKRVDEYLAENGVTKDNLIAEVLAEDLETIERLERLISLAETRRNASLAEIYRHRFALGQALQRTVQISSAGRFR